MKILLPLIALLIAVGLAFYYRSQDPERHPEWLPQIIGEYRGVVAMGGNEWPITTRFYFSTDGELVANYQVHQNGEPLSGQMSLIAGYDDRALKMNWIEQKGSGTFRAHFDPSFDSFEAHWKSSSFFSKKYKWTGKRAATD